MYTRVQIPFSAPGNERLVAFCYKSFLLQKSPNTILGLSLERGVYRKLHAFLPFELVHDVRIYTHGELWRGVPDKLLTHRDVHPTFRTPRYVRMP